MPQTTITYTCVESKKEPLSSKMPEEDKGMLRKEGYSLSEDAPTRHEALKKAIKMHGYNDVIWHINFIRNITGSEDNKKTLVEDMEYVQKLKREEVLNGDKESK